MKKIITLILTIIGLNTFAQFNPTYDTVKFRRGGKIYQLITYGNADSIKINGITYYTSDVPVVNLWQTYSTDKIEPNPDSKKIMYPAIPSYIDATFTGSAANGGYKPVYYFSGNKVLALRATSVGPPNDTIANTDVRDVYVYTINDQSDTVYVDSIKNLGGIFSIMNNGTNSKITLLCLDSGVKFDTSDFYILNYRDWVTFYPDSLSNTIYTHGNTISDSTMKIIKDTVIAEYIKDSATWQHTLSGKTILKNPTDTVQVGIAEIGTVIDSNDVRFWGAKNDESDVTTAFTNALANRKNVTINTPGTYGLSAPLHVSSNKHIKGVDGVILKKLQSYSHVFVNDASATTGTVYDSNIVIEDLMIDCNNYGTQTGAASPTANGQIQLAYVDNVEIKNVSIIRSSLVMFGIHLQSVINSKLEGLNLIGKKDGIHLNGGCHDVVIDKCDIRTDDDNFGIITADYPRLQHNCSDIYNITITNCFLGPYSMPSTGYATRFLTGSWLAWNSGNTYMIGHTVNNAGYHYKMVNNDTLVAANAPTHSSGDVTGADGITWRWVGSGTNTTSNIYNIKYSNIQIDENRAIIRAVNNDSYEHNEYPGTENTSQVDYIFANGVTNNDGYDIFVKSSGLTGTHYGVQLADVDERIPIGNLTGGMPVWNNDSMRYDMTSEVKYDVTNKMFTIISSGNTSQWLTSSGGNNTAIFHIQNGDNTTSARYAYFEFKTLETSGIRWDAGLMGDKNFSIFNGTNSTYPFILHSSTGTLNLFRVNCDGKGSVTDLLYMSNDKNATKDSIFKVNSKGDAETSGTLKIGSIPTTLVATPNVLTDSGNNVKQIAATSLPIPTAAQDSIDKITDSIQSHNDRILALKDTAAKNLDTTQSHNERLKVLEAFYINDSTNKYHGMYKLQSYTAMDDETSISLGANCWGFGQIRTSNNDFASFDFYSDGTVNIHSISTANVVNTDSDGKFCIYDGGDHIVIKNRIGGGIAIVGEINYSNVAP